MSIKARRTCQQALLDRTLSALLAPRKVLDRDIVALDAGIFDGECWISHANYTALQTALRQWHRIDAAASRRAAGTVVQRALVRLTTSPYQLYLSRLQARRAARRLTIPWVVDHIPRSTPHQRRPGEKMAPRYLTIHSTGNPMSKASGERNWLTNAQNDRTASFHIVVDETQAIECIPFDEVAWHAGDGNGDGNRRSISIEICESGNRGKVLRHAVALAARVLRDADLDGDKLRRHRDWSSKLCPRILIVDANRADPGHTWDWFKSEVEALL